LGVSGRVNGEGEGGRIRSCTLYIYFLWAWGLNFALAKQVLYHLNHTFSSSMYFINFYEDKTMKRFEIILSRGEGE
jgi:hypothetical protein